MYDDYTILINAYYICYLYISMYLCKFGSMRIGNVIDYWVGTELVPDWYRRRIVKLGHADILQILWLLFALVYACRKYHS
jgi:hypothetical protein